MSSDVDDEQVLPDSLQKLEIVPIYSRKNASNDTKSKECRSQNPFSIMLDPNEIDERIPKEIFGPTCTSCENSDGKCRTGNSSKNAIRHHWRMYRGNNSNQSANNHHICIGNNNNNCGIERTIQKQIQFKQRSEKQIKVLSEKKLTILRDPILKSIGRSIYHNSRQHGLQCTNAGNLISRNVGRSLSSPSTLSSSSTSTTSTIDPFELNYRKFSNKINNSTIESGFDRTIVHSTTTGNGQNSNTNPNSNNVMIENLQKWHLDDESTIDFKSLVNDCSNMSLLNNTNTNNINTTNTIATNNNNNNNNNNSNNNSNNSNNCSIDELHKTRNFQVLQTTTSASIETDPLTTIPGDNIDSRDVDNSIDTNINNLAAILNTNSSISNNNSNNSSSSCSQQARMNSSNCDVTIDELASYFETFVHIPKKMSSMAEMMYI